MEMCSVCQRNGIVCAVLCLKKKTLKGKNETPYSMAMEFSINKLRFPKLVVI